MWCKKDKSEPVEEPETQPETPPIGTVLKITRAELGDGDAVLETTWREGLRGPVKSSTMLGADGTSQLDPQPRLGPDDKDSFGRPRKYRFRPAFKLDDQEKRRLAEATRQD